MQNLVLFSKKKETNRPIKILLKNSPRKEDDSSEFRIVLKSNIVVSLTKESRVGFFGQ